MWMFHGSSSGTDLSTSLGPSCPSACATGRVGINPNGYWYYGDAYRDEKANFKGPYSSLASVTLMLARELLKEVSRRQARMAQPTTPAE
jgi:hypothetical protein